MTGPLGSFHRELFNLFNVNLFLILQALQRAGQIISEIRDTHVW